MTGLTTFNGSHHPRACSFAGRRADETLHDFLLRRHDEMGAEIAMLEVMIERQTATLIGEREAGIRNECSLLVGQAWIAAFFAGVCSICLPGDWFILVLGVATASRVGGSAILRLPQALERAFHRIRSWRWR